MEMYACEFETLLMYVEWMNLGTAAQFVWSGGTTGGMILLKRNTN